MSTFSNIRWLAFFKRTKRSAIGSFMALPARFHDAGDLAPMRHLPKTKAAESKIPIERAPPTAVSTAVPETGREFLRSAHLGDDRNSCHKSSLCGCRRLGRRRRAFRFLF